MARTPSTARATKLGRIGARLALLATLVAGGCGPILVERSGRQVFNPRYGFLLDSPERDLWQKPREVLAAVGVTEGSSVADIGAGTGYFTRVISETVGRDGLVWATDVQPEMIARLEALAARDEYANVRVVNGAFEQPNLPAGCCDVVLFANVYKEIDPRVPFLRATMPALREGGRIAIVGFPPETRGPGPPAAIRLTADQVIAECEAADLRFLGRHDFLPRQYMLVFEPERTLRVNAPAERQLLLAE